jgi:hypothetical protein
VTSPRLEPRTRIALPGRAAVSDPQSVRHVTVEAVGGIDGAVPPLDAVAGATAMAFSTAMTTTVRRFSWIHSPG